MRPIVALFGIVLMAGSAQVQSGETEDKAAQVKQACIETSKLSEPLCACVADRSSTQISPRGRDFFLAILQGDETQARSLRATLPPQEMTVVMVFMNDVQDQCAEELDG